MNLRQFEIFCAIAEHRHFKRAGASIGVTQSAVTQALKTLEADFETKLIDRSQRPLELTVAGETLLKGARAMLASMDRLKHDVAGATENRQSRISVGAIVSAGISYLPSAIAEFSASFPGVDVRTAFGTSERVAEMILGGEVDLGLVSFPQSTGPMRVVPWIEEPMRVICSVNHPWAQYREVDVRQLGEVPMIGFNRALRLRQRIDEVLVEAGVEADVTMEFDNADSMIRAIQATDGVGILPEMAVRRETAAGTLKVVATRGFRMTRPLGVAFKRDQRPGAATIEFIRTLTGRSIDAHPKPDHAPANRVSVVA